MLISTYRLQLNAAFTLNDARERVPYLRALGVSHLYLSPVLAARAGSTHGYDVTDPTQVSAALGGDDAFVALAHAVHAQDMGILLDIVPNHMGVGADNPFWDDLLAHGRESRYADWFDVAWRAPTRRLEGKVLVPILGDTLEKVIARGEITLASSGDTVRVRYFDHHFPLDPRTITPEVRRDPAAYIAGDDGRERLAKLLGAQHYELAFWRAAQRDVNYRRFFDVNDLVCLRVEQRDVFEATHRTVLRFVAAGLVDGLRIDHIDGLLEPRRYLERLRAAVDERRPAHGGATRFPIVVEKILASGETLPASWPVDGTTGYEFMTTLEDVFIDEPGYAQLETRYIGRGDRAVVNFADIARRSKGRVLRGALNADIRRIAPMLADVAKRAGWARRPIAAYAGAMVELTAELPVYRTYIDAECPDASATDRTVLVGALAAARSAQVDGDAMAALEHVLLDSWRDAEPSLARARLAFVLRWQQLTGPAAAKGVEDTALYVYAPLTSRNEVGGDPGQPLSGAVTRLHARLAERAARHPRSLNATNTHDTKRSADARARIDALSEHATEWDRALRRWRRRHRVLRSPVNGRLVPTRAEEDFVHQSLLGVWPLAAAGLLEDARVVDLRERLAAYLQKAMREAKIGTSWTDPNAAYEGAITKFLARLLDRTSPESRAYVAEMQALVARVAPQAMWNALGRLVVHLTAPGVPDMYQGDELWYAALVDPDNRRPVDWPARERVLADVARASEEKATKLPQWRDGMRADELKMYVARTLLSLRRDPAGALAGAFEPLFASGTHAERVLAYRRGSAGEQAIIIVGRRLAALRPQPLGSVWGDTTLGVSHTSWHCVIHGRQVSARDGVLRVADAFSELPLAVLLPE